MLYNQYLIHWFILKPQALNCCFNSLHSCVKAFHQSFAPIQPLEQFGAFSTQKLSQGTNNLLKYKLTLLAFQPEEPKTKFFSFMIAPWLSDGSGTVGAENKGLNFS